MSAHAVVPAQAAALDVAEVIRRMSAPEFARLIDVALGKIADDSDWEVILKAHAALDKAFERGRTQGRREGMDEAFADAKRPMQDFIDRLQAGSRRV